jgi:hypothetical protein
VASSGCRIGVLPDGLPGCHTVNVPTPAEGHAIRPFDNAALYAALDEKRTALGLSWQSVADQMWEQSAALNDRRQDHPISPSTLTNVSRSQRTSCQHALFMLRWLGHAPESFLLGVAEADELFNLPAADQDHRLRWALKLLYVALDEKRREEGLTWVALAAALECSPGQLTGLRTAKYATTTDLAMRITQWLGRPAVDFVYPAAWLAAGTRPALPRTPGGVAPHDVNHEVASRILAVDETVCIYAGDGERQDGGARRQRASHRGIRASRPRPQTGRLRPRRWGARGSFPSAS